MNPVSTLDRIDGEARARTTGQDLAAISTRLVQLYSRHAGKGPTKARTHISGDTVVCVFRDPYTVSERTLHERGEGPVVKRMRDGLHAAIEEDSRRIVEEGCRRKVIACLAATHLDPDVVVQIFMLEPQPNGSSHSDGPFEE